MIPSWNQFFAAYELNEAEQRLDLRFTVRISDPRHEAAVAVMKGMSEAFPGLRWTQGPSGHKPAGDYAFLPAAVE